MPVGQLSYNIWKYILSAQVRNVVPPCGQDLLFRTYRLKMARSCPVFHIIRQKNNLSRKMSLNSSYNLSVLRAEGLDVTNRLTQGHRSLNCCFFKDEILTLDQTSKPERTERTGADI
jgi:hypothetical protein